MYRARIQDSRPRILSKPRPLPLVALSTDAVRCTSYRKLINHYALVLVFQVTTKFNEATNETEIVATSLRQDPIYTSVYVVWSKLILTDLVPYFIILVLNSFIVVKIVKSSKFRAKILESRNEHQTNVSEKPQQILVF